MGCYVAVVGAFMALIHGAVLWAAWSTDSLPVALVVTALLAGCWVSLWSQHRRGRGK